MTQIEFPIFGTEIAPSYGRSILIGKLASIINKPSQHQTQIVGPRYSGKTTVLKALEKEILNEASPNISIIYWNLGHQTPSSNEQLLEQLCKKLGDAINATHSLDAKLLIQSPPEDLYDNLYDVIEGLSEEDHKVVILLDSFEKALASPSLSRNLWDQLRELASLKNLKLVTASRKTVREEIRSEDSLASPFFNLFASPIRVDCLSADEQSEVISHLSNYNFDQGSIKQIENWTGSFPPLFFGLLNQIQNTSSGSVSTEVVNEAANSMLDDAYSIVDELWRDLAESSKNLVRHLMEHESSPVSDFEHDDIKNVEYCGFIKATKNQLKLSNFFLKQFLTGRGKETGSLVHLFKKYENYRANIRAVLEYRVNQIPQFDNELLKLINRSINDIPDDPEICLKWIRQIVDESFKLIWKKEFGPAHEIPDDYLKYWKRRQPSNMGEIETTVPRGRADQIRLLKFLTGSFDNCDPKAKFVSKNTYTLSNTLHCMGNFGEHLEGTKPTLGIAISAVSMSIELAHCLSKELNGNQADQD